MTEFSDDDRRDLETLATRVNGYVYHGDRLNALVETVEALRADPDLAARLLGFRAREEWGYKYDGPNPPEFMPKMIPFSREEAEEMRDIFAEKNGSNAHVVVRKIWTGDWEVMTDGATSQR